MKKTIIRFDKYRFEVEYEGTTIVSANFYAEKPGDNLSTVDYGNDRIAQELQEKIVNYLSTGFIEFSGFSLDLSFASKFEKKVYLALRNIKPGQTITYGELAYLAGYPRAARGVGRAMAKNRIQLFIP